MGTPLFGSVWYRTSKPLGLLLRPVWIGGGQYNCGAEGRIPAGICGTREKPILFRAVPGARATINGMICAGKGCHHRWWWGVEITGPVGSGVTSDVLKKGEKFRIMEVHDLWAKPALQGVYQGGPVEFSVSGAYAPEFGCHVLFRDRREP